MGSIAGHKYPEHSIDEVLEIIEIIGDEDISDQELLAERLGHKSSDSGAFRNKLTSLRRYGLINQRGEVRLTPLASRINLPESGTDERERAISEAVLNVDLLESLYDRLDYGRPDENFFIQIAQVTGAERDEADDKSSQIEQLYVAGLPYVKRAATDDSEASPEDVREDREDESPGKPTIPDDADATLSLPDGTTIHVRGSASYVAARALLRDVAKDYDVENDEEEVEEILQHLRLKPTT